MNSAYQLNLLTGLIYCINMGQKVHPTIFRIGIIRTWNSQWFSKRSYAEFLHEDILIRAFLKKRLAKSGVEVVLIERRSAEDITINIRSAKPGVIISRGGQGIEDLTKALKKFIKPGRKISLNVVEIKRPALSAAVAVEQIIGDLERRMPYRRVLKQILQKVKEAGGGGAKVQVSGRLNGAEIARREHLEFGKIPLHTLRANIEYCRGVANTIFGTIGVKVWIYKGDIFKKKEETEE